MNPVFEINNLQFRYQKASDDTIKTVSFTVDEGKIFGLLGPSGAGKSTIQKLLIKLLSGYNGTIYYKGKDLKTYDKRFYEDIGVCFEAPVHFNKLTALENMKYFASLYQNQVDYQELLKRVNLEDALNQEVGTFSKGMKVRLNFVRSLLNAPKVLFLDEPTNGLDPVNARIVKTMVREFKENGGTVFLTTHLMGDVDELCDEILFIKDGKVTEKANPRDLKLKYGKKEVTVEYLDNGVFASQKFALSSLSQSEEFFNILATKQVETIHTGETTLDEIFIKVMNGNNKL